MRKLLYKSFVAIYSVVGAIALYGMIIGICSYAIVMGFYAVNTSWVAPVLVSPSADKILALTEQLVSSQSALDALYIDKVKTSKTLVELIQERLHLIELGAKLDTATQASRSSDAKNGLALVELSKTKRSDLVTSIEAFSAADQVRVSILKDLRTGLISKGDAAIQISQIVQSGGAITDSRIQEVLLNDAIKQKLTQDEAKVGIQTQRELLRAQLAQTDIALSVGTAQLQSDLAQISQVTRAMDVARDTPYYRVSQATSNLTFAFVPYDNDSNAKVGAPVYSCYLSMIACHKVGVITQVFHDEEHATNPFLKTEVRGFLIEASLINQKYAKSKTMFIGGKPLWF